MARAALCVLLLALTACVGSIGKPDTAAIEGYEHAWATLDPSNPGGYHREIDLIRSPLFRTVPALQQHDRLREAARLALGSHDYATGHEFARRSSELPGADVEDWQLRFDAAYFSGAHLDARRAMTQLARRWPIELQQLNPSVVREVARYPSESPIEKRARFELLAALYAAYWTAEDEVAPYRLWGQLAAELFEKGEVNRALKVARRVDSPRFALWMHVDKRFDGFVSREPQAFDIERAAQREVADWLDAVNRYPKRLDPIVQLSDTLLSVGRYAEGLNITSAVLAKVRDSQGFKRVFDDDDTEVNWLLSSHSHALESLQRWRDAEWELREAADRQEHGQRNVSNVIDLAQFEAEQGRGEEALKTIAELPQDPAAISAYGRMQLYFVRVTAAVDEDDPALEDQCITYMRAHQQDAPATYQWALVQVNRTDEAARLLIQRLADPETRGEALLAVQRYRDPPVPPGIERLQERWRQIIRREDVQKAIARVGRIIDVDLPS